MNFDLDNLPSVVIGALASVSSIVLGIEYAKGIMQRRYNLLNRPVVSEEDLSSLRNASLENIQALVCDYNVRLLGKYYEQYLLQYKKASHLALVGMAAGIIVAFSGVYFAFVGEVSVAILSLSFSATSEIISVIVFKWAKEATRHISEHHKYLVIAEYLLVAISLAKSLPPDKSQGQIEAIIKDLLGLANHLHGVSANNAIVAT